MELRYSMMYRVIVVVVIIGVMGALCGLFFPIAGRSSSAVISCMYVLLFVCILHLILI